MQPIFSVDATRARDRHGLCRYRASRYAPTFAPTPQKFAAAGDIDAFMKAQHYHPAQCAISSGQLQHRREVILEYVRRMHLAGFNMHIHTISDRAVRTGVDAIEAARAADGKSNTRDALAHLQLATAADVARIGRDHLYRRLHLRLDEHRPDYDMTVIPFFEKVQGNSYEALHRPGSYYETNTYPVRAIKAAGGILAAGSDAPIETRDPDRSSTWHGHHAQPSGQPVSESPAEHLIAGSHRGVHHQWRAHAGNAGGCGIHRSRQVGRLRRDRPGLAALADGGHPEAIANTRVLETWFRGTQSLCHGRN